MPSLTSLVDNFNDAVIGPDWGNSYGAVTETGGRARVPCTTGSNGYQTGFSWTMAGASLYVKVPTIPAPSTATTATCSVLVDAPDIATSGLRIGFTIKAVSGLLRMHSDSGLADPGAIEIAYNAVTHAFLRLREDGTNVYWDTSPDGTTWTTRRTLATPAWITASTGQCSVELTAQRDAGTSDYAEFDLVNTLSDGAVYTGTATGSAQSSASATGTYTATSTAAASGQATATVTGKATYRGTAHGSASSHATATGAGADFPEVANLAAGRLDLRIEQGSTFVQTYTVTDDGFTWAGWTPRAQIRTGPADHGTLLLDLTPYLTVTGPAIRLAIPASITQTLDRNGVWDLEMSNPPAVVRLLEGKAIVSLEVTR